MFIAEIAAQFLLFFGLYYFADCFYGGVDIQNIIGNGIWILLYAAGTSIVREKVKKFWIFVLVHFVFAGASVLCMASGLWNGVLAVMMCLQVLYSFVESVSRGRIGLRQWGYAQAVLLALLYLVDKLFYEKPTTNFLWFIFFLYVVVLLFYRNRQAAEEYIEVRRRNTIMNEVPMKKVSKLVTGMYVLLTGLLIFFISVPFLSWDTPDLNVESDWKLVVAPSGMNGTDYFRDMMETTEGDVEAPVEQKNYPGLELAMKIVAFVLLAIVVVGVLYSAMKYVQDSFQKNDSEDKVDFMNPFDKTESIREKPAKERVHVRKSNREKVRHIYKKRMKGFWHKRNVAPDKTTPAMQWELKQQQEADLPKELVDIYEKARYSQENITETDVEIMKKL